jgi:hypothetical protein
MAWNTEVSEVKKRNNIEHEVLSLNIGGESELSVSKQILCQEKGSYLERMFSGDHQLKIIEN